MSLRPLLGVVLLALIVLPSPDGPESVEGANLGASSLLLSIPLEDDRGRPLDHPVRACFVVGLEQLCEEVEPEGALVWPPGAEQVRLDGPRHGPVTARRSDLAGAEALAVARKTRLRVRTSLAGGRLVATTYPVDDPLFQSPLAETSVTPAPSDGEGEGVDREGEAWIPSGPLLVSLGARAPGGAGLAPDLHALVAPPGGTVSLRHRPAPGWSVVLRLVDPVDPAVAASARTTLSTVDGLGPRSQEAETAQRRTARTGPGQLVTFSGLEAPLAIAVVEAPDRLDATVRGLAATAGTFALRTVTLRRGATLEATVRSEGEPRAATCRLFEIATPTGPRDRRQPVEPLATATTGENGRCRLVRLPAGEHVLSVEPEPGADTESGPEPDLETGAATATAPGRLDRPVHLVEAQTLSLDVELDPLVLDGAVRRGDDPAPGYGVELLPFEPAATRPGEALVRTSTDDEGRFRAILWNRNPLLLVVSAPSGVPVTVRPLHPFGAEETVEVELSPLDLAGRVVDGGGEPVDGAAVALVIDGAGHRSTVTGDDGEFRFPLETARRLRVQARKAGFTEPAPVVVDLAEGIEPPPVTLVLERLPALRGRVTAAGAPAPATHVALTPAAGAAVVDRDVTDAAGAFVLAGGAETDAAVVTSGPACPLTIVRLGDLGVEGMGSGMGTGTSEPLELGCSDTAASLDLAFSDPTGRPLAGHGVLLARRGSAVPHGLLAEHLGRWGLPALSDASGHLLLFGLAPGEWDLYLVGASSAESIGRGAPAGSLGSVNLAPGTTAELVLSLD